MQGTSYRVPGEVPTTVIQLQVYERMMTNGIQFILNCTSSEALVESTAEFLSNGNTINNIRTFHGICLQTINKSACYPEICDCHVEGNTSWYYIVIEKPINDEQFSCRIRGIITSGNYGLVLEGIWNNESKSQVVRVSNIATNFNILVGSVINTPLQT
ncbi:Hypothetical predicted protein [Mytilus galloprovincialis]|uniref:Uncharacterized protein n=1 Tax=Mytilus galloprovincialis TaxID=29158 RepID=A0A8B6EQE0_MYTGA|nr:Hypothetical predicted protein [Mytilus galloprovincialis]